MTLRSAKSGEDGFERVAGELAAMHRGRRQTAERFGNLLVGDATGLGERHAADHLGQQRPQAIAVTHPRVLKRASSMRPVETRTASCMMSPQTGFETSTVAVASGSSPALRGFLK